MIPNPKAIKPLPRSFWIVLVVLLLLLILPVLVGCVQSLEQRVAEYKERCALYGYEEGSRPFADCVRKEETRWDTQVYIDDWHDWDDRVYRHPGYRHRW